MRVPPWVCVFPLGILQLQTCPVTTDLIMLVFLRTTTNTDKYSRLTISTFRLDQGYGSGGTPVFTGVFEPLARVTLYLTPENGLGSCFGAA